MARRRRRERVDGLDDPVQRAVGADRHVRPDQVVVDRPDQPRDHQRRVASACSTVIRSRSTSSASSS
ncbi:hypothetical protein, partial [Arsenicicoccus piscis]|uniref:hypothetical protein n=1 Tax=Arsenicicoccus piscis TaxID=673954 RepID=UPI0024E0D025